MAIDDGSAAPMMQDGRLVAVARALGAARSITELLDLLTDTALRSRGSPPGDDECGIR